MIDTEENTMMMTAEESRDILNVEDAARYLRCAVSTVYRDTAAGLIPHVRMGRRVLFIKTDLLEWIAGKRQEVRGVYGVK